MTRWRVAGILWLIAALSSGGIAFFLTDPLTLGLFIVGAAAGVVLGLWCLIRPSAALVTASAVAAVAWLIAYGIVIALNISNPVEEVVSVIWVAILGVLAGVSAYRARAVIA